MEKENEHIKTFGRRALIIGALQGGLMSVLVGRLAWLQIVQGKKYTMLADNNRINIKVLPPSRGLILDRYGVTLAENNQNFRVLITPERTKDLQKTLLKLTDIVPLTDHEIQRILKKAKSNAGFVPLEVADNLTWEDLSKVEVNLYQMPGLSIDVGEIRNYPLKDVTAHVVGYVGAVNKSELTGDPVLTLPGFKIGKTGLEKFHDADLRGKAGTAEIEINVTGREVRELKRQKSAGGKQLTLSIDSELQAYTQQRLSEEKSATAVIMDAHTGAVYSLVSSPSFDPNLFTKGLSAEKWEELLANPGHPLNNKATSGQYPPGSTFKMVTALAGLEENITTRTARHHCEGVYTYGKDRFHCWKSIGHGHVNVIDALAESCDIYFYEIATKIGIDTLAEYAKKLGLGQKYGIHLPGERAGLVPTKNWKMGYFGASWQPGETIVSSIGQGYIQATPLQMAVMTARLVNGGYAVEPWITAAIDNNIYTPPKWPQLGFKPQNLKTVMTGMERAVGHASGTAYDSRLENPKMQMGGKTGTSQVKRISAKQREEGTVNKDMPWHLRHHALFVGYAPVHNPRYVCSVVVEHGGSGSAAAAPIARDLLQKAQEHNPAAYPLHNQKHVMNSQHLPVPNRKPDRKTL